MSDFVQDLNWCSHRTCSHSLVIWAMQIVIVKYGFICTPAMWWHKKEKCVYPIPSMFVLHKSFFGAVKQFKLSSCIL